MVWLVPTPKIEKWQPESFQVSGRKWSHCDAIVKLGYAHKDGRRLTRNQFKKESGWTDSQIDEFLADSDYQLAKSTGIITRGSTYARCDGPAQGSLPLGSTAKPKQKLSTNKTETPKNRKPLKTNRQTPKTTKNSGTESETNWNLPYIERAREKEKDKQNSYSSSLSGAQKPVLESIENWEPTDTTITQAKARFPSADLADELDRMRDWYNMRDRRVYNYDAALMNWLQRGVDYRSRQTPLKQPPIGGTTKPRSRRRYGRQSEEERRAAKLERERRFLNPSSHNYVPPEVTFQATDEDRAYLAAEEANVPF